MAFCGGCIPNLVSIGNTLDQLFITSPLVAFDISESIEDSISVNDPKGNKF